MALTALEILDELLDDDEQRRDSAKRVSDVLEDWRHPSRGSRTRERTRPREDVLERVTHNAAGDIIDQYTHFDWEPLCEAVACIDYGWRPAAGEAPAPRVTAGPARPSGQPALARVANVETSEDTNAPGPKAPEVHVGLSPGCGPESKDAIERGTMARSQLAIAPSHVERKILLLRGERVLLDSDLATLYGVETRLLLRAVKRNLGRFPADFMFQLTADEVAILRSQIGISSSSHGGRRYAPYAFTEHGVAMLSAILRSPRAVQVSIEVVRAFVRLRAMLAGDAELARKLVALEKKYDAQFRVVFDAIRELMSPPPKRRRPIGFSP